MQIRDRLQEIDRHHRMRATQQFQAFSVNTEAEKAILPLKKLTTRNASILHERQFLI